MWRQALIPEIKPWKHRMMKDFYQPTTFSIEVDKWGMEKKCEEVAREIGLRCKGVSYENGSRQMIFEGTPEMETELRLKLGK